MTRPRVSTRASALALGWMLAGSAGGATITIVNNDGAGEGFNDPTPTAPEGGNSGVTRGQQRLNLFQSAASVWAATLQSTIEIKVNAQFNPLTCSQTSAVLGSAGPNGFVSNYPNAPQASTWYHIALAESLALQNFNTTQVEINATFNSSIDTGCFGNPPRRWWYGTNPAIAPAANTVVLFPVVLHELAHGLGFSTPVCVVSAGCGAGAPQGSLLQGQNDSWTRFLRDVEVGLNWNAMSDAQRAASMINDPDLVWVGPQVTAAIPTFAPTGAGVNGAGINARMRMNAPNPVVPGSSVSHFTSAPASPDLLMEPSLSAGLFNATDMTVPLFRDIGWQVVVGANQPPVITRPLTLAVTEDIASPVTGVSVVDPDAGSGNFTITFSAPSGTFNSPGCTGVTSGGTASARTLSGTLTNLNTCLSGSSLQYTTALNSTASVTLTIVANDNGNTGSGGAMSDTESTMLNVTAVNDAPVNTVPGSITVTEDVATALAGISFADLDIAAGNLQVTLGVPSGTINFPVCTGVATSGSATARVLTGTLAQVNACFASASRPTYTTASNATAAVNLTVTSSDNGNTGTGGALGDSDVGPITVTAVNDAPTVTLPSSIPILVPGTTPLRDIGVADIDSAGAAVTATLAVPLGTLVATSGGGVTVAGSGTPTVILTGNIANLATFLDADLVSYTAGNDTTLTVTLNDLGNTGMGGAQSTVAMTPLVGDAIFSNSFE